MIAYLRLVRFPNVFTSLADIAAGFLIMRAACGASVWEAVVPLALASACLYLSGMALNDLADREEDAKFRPNRPIPSGAVSLKGAVLCGVGLMALGVVAAMAAGTTSLFLALFLAVSILLYDFAAKHVELAGPLALGFCRFFNLQLGMSYDLNFAPWLALPSQWRVVYGPAAAVGIYAAGMTAFSAQEETGKRIRAIVLGWCFVGGALALAGYCMPSPWGWAPLGALAAVLAWRTAALAKAGTPVAARNLVKTGVLGICVLDAGQILGHYGTAAWPYALGVALLILPALVLGKWLAQKEA
ncbi:MAG: UbiA family prenyltransferase [Planctomycetota bacterium]|nr:UbiA family prenyltransferase [Planctomycetota bacterium]